MAGRKRPQRRFDIWPGFVDALSGLLIVFVIVSMIFMTAQFFLGEELVGRDRTIDRLMAQIATLTTELEEGQGRAEAAEGKVAQAERSIAALTGELRSAEDTRDRLAADKAELERSLTGLRADRQGLLVRLDTLEKDRKDLLLRIAGLEQQADRLALQLAEALKSGKAADARAADLQQQLTGRIARLEAENAALRDRLSGVVAQRQGAEARADAAAAAGREAATRAAELAVEKQRLEDNLAAMVRQLSAIEAENRALTARLAKTVAARTALGRRAAELGRARDDLDARIAQMVKRIARLDGENRRLAAQLEAARAGGAEAADRAAALTDRQTALEQERGALARRLAELRDRHNRLRAELASVLQQRQALEREAGTLRERQTELNARLDRIERDRGQLREQLASAEQKGADLGGKLDEAEKRIAAIRSVSTDRSRQVELLNAQLVGLRRQLRSIQEALDVSEARGAQQQLKIADLDRRLKAALVRQVNELRQYKSEFFGELRKAIGGRQDVKIVGDRFVLPSSVLFRTNSSRLGENGRTELRKLATTLQALARNIPENIDWILRIDGHTDSRPFRGGDNLRLSTDRAIAVVDFLAEQGIPKGRLLAAGFGPHRPLDPGTTEEAHRKNRRIEVKLTQR